MINSRTTQNSVIGTGFAATLLLGVFSFIRSKYPDLMWDESADDKVVLYLTAILGPLLARQIAFIRNPEKKK